MTMLESPSSPSSSSRMPRKFIRKCERYCCMSLTYFPLFFVYSLTTWACWVEATIGFIAPHGLWIGKGSSYLGILIYLLLNWSYTTAVFTDPGSTVSTKDGYSSLPTSAPRAADSVTVKANGEIRFCKKCQAQKPDRAHHCSTCRKCVLKMDHHCPWLATCVGLRNYKAFLLFLIYTTVFCFVCFGVSGTWVYQEIINDGQYTESLMPVNYVMLAVVSGIIGLVVGGFTCWHILLAARGQTTIECLEKTRYLSPLRKSAQHHHIPGRHSDMHNNENPNIVTSAPVPIEQRPLRNGETRYATYDEMERRRARERYDQYLDEQDSEKLPSAFNLGWRRNLIHLFGPRRALWFLPIQSTTGDGWNWEPSPKWIKAREDLAREREAQRSLERAAGWGGEPSPPPVPVPREGAGRHYVDSYPTRTPSKADKILGRTPEQYADSSDRHDSNAVSLQTLRPRGREESFDDFDDSDEEPTRRSSLERKIITEWPRQVTKLGIMANTVLGNTLARKKDDAKGWDGLDDDVD